MDLRETNFSEYNRHPWELARFRILLYMLNRFFQKDERLRILDLGSGDAYFIAELSKIFVNSMCTGIDPAYTEETIRRLNNAYTDPRLNLHKGIEILSRSQTTQYDLVLLLDVIEHIENDALFLEKLTSLSYFSQNTLFVITVPAFPSLFSSHDRFLKHYRRYTNYGLKKILIDNGFKLEESGSFFFSLLLPRAVTVIAERMWRKGNMITKTAMWSGGTLKTDLLVRLLISDYIIIRLFNKIGIKIPGLSNYALCKICV